MSHEEKQLEERVVENQEKSTDQSTGYKRCRSVGHAVQLFESIGRPTDDKRRSIGSCSGFGEEHSESTELTTRGKCTSFSRAKERFESISKLKSKNDTRKRNSLAKEDSESSGRPTDVLESKNRSTDDSGKSDSLAKENSESSGGPTDDSGGSLDLANKVLEAKGGQSDSGKSDSLAKETSESSGRPTDDSTRSLDLAKECLESKDKLVNDSGKGDSIAKEDSEPSGPPNDDSTKSVDLAKNDFESTGQPSDDKRRSVMLLGKTGCGKSTLGNFLVGGEKKFYVAKGAQWGSVTVESMDATCTHDDRLLHIVDTPGFCDSDVNKREKNLEEIANGLMRAREGVHALIICNNLVHRFSDEEKTTLQTLDQLENLWDHAMVIFTNADRLGDTIEEQEMELKASLSRSNCPEGMKTLMKKTKNRYVLVESINTKSSEYHHQKLTEVFAAIDKICDDNSERKYNNRLFELAMKHYNDAKTKLLRKKEHSKANQLEQLQKKENKKAAQQEAESTSQTEETQSPKTPEITTKDLTVTKDTATLTNVETSANTSSKNVEGPDLEKQAETMARKPFKEELRKDTFMERYLIKPDETPFETSIEVEDAELNSICSVM